MKNKTLLFLNVLEVLVQSNWSILSCPYWWMKKPENIMLHIGSNDITKTNYDNVNAKDLVEQIINSEQKM